MVAKMKALFDGIAGHCDPDRYVSRRSHGAKATTMVTRGSIVIEKIETLTKPVRTER
jgi:hypothetical protein